MGPVFPSSNNGSAKIERLARRLLLPPMKKALDTILLGPRWGADRRGLPRFGQGLPGTWVIRFRSTLQQSAAGPSLRWLRDRCPDPRPVPGPDRGACMELELSDARIDALLERNARFCSPGPDRTHSTTEGTAIRSCCLAIPTRSMCPRSRRSSLERTGSPTSKALFHGAYYSCEIGLRKPDASAFHHVLERHSADPSRTLFIDDSIQHVHGARNAGLKAEHLDLGKEDVIHLVDRLRLV